jgi:hypothetical protein
MGEGIDHSSSGGWCFQNQFVYSRRVFPSIDLCYSSDADHSVRVAFEHEFLERAHLFQVALLCCPKDTLSQVTNSSIGFVPVDGIPIGLLLGSVCEGVSLHPTFPLMSSFTSIFGSCTRITSAAFRRGSFRFRPYLPSYDFLWPFGWQRSLLDPSPSH